MARSTPEWIGKTLDTPVPDRVRLRVFDRDGKCCRICTRDLSRGEPFITDHKNAIINGGENRERNLQTICEWCDDKIKTPADVALKAKTYKRRKSYHGLRTAKHLIPGSKGSGWKKTFSYGWVRR